MDLDLVSLYETATRSVIGVAVLVFCLLQFIDAPYGRYVSDSWGPTLPAKVGWIAMEIPSPLAMVWVYSQGPHSADALPLFFLTLFQLHYVNRSVVQPMLARGSGRRTTLFIVVAATVFNSLNGALIGFGLTHMGSYPDGWWTDPRFIGGVALFVTGASINIHADAVLRGLRAPGESGYRIPNGGPYRWVSCPNYLGEILEWLGFALATWSMAGLAFALFTFANLAPRAVANHKWYQERFEDYPSQRRALFPGLF